LVVLLSAGFGSADLLSAQEPAAPQEITMVEGITEYRLDNGLKILLFPDPSKPTVTVNLTVFVGSRHEGYGEAGMAHLLEHMVFKGTPTHPQIPKALQERGANFNGTTWLDRTNYYETLPASDDNLEFAIRLEADRMVNSYIKAEDLASEMTVVRNEFEQGENRPTSILYQRMMSAAFQWHNYGQSTIGNRADIERVPVERLRAFYEKYYQPDNAMLVVAGQFDPDKALEYITKYFGAIPRPERVLDATYTEEPAQDGERFVTLRRVGDVAAVGAVYHIPAGPHPDYAAIDVLESILTDQPSGRLYKALVESKKASNVYGSAFALHDPGVLLFMSEVSQGNDPQIVLEAMLDVLEGMGKSGVTQAEVDRAKQGLLKQFELAAADSRRIAINLSDWAAQGDWRLYFLYRDRVEQVTPEDVQRVAAAYLKQNNRTAGIYFPTKEPQRASVPQTPELADMLKDYVGREAIAQGEQFDVSPTSIEARTQRFAIPGGIQAAFLEKRTRGQSVNLRLNLRYGNESNLRGKAAAVEFLPSLMLRGTEKLSRQELQDELDKYRATISGSSSPGVATFTIETRREYLPEVLEILRQVLREPTLPESEFEILQRAQISSLEQSLTDPRALAFRTTNNIINPYPKDDPRYQPTVEEQLEMVKALTRDDIKELYDRFLGGQTGELTIVGDFDVEEVKPQLTKMFAGWQAAQPQERLARLLDPKLKGQSHVLLTPDKANAVYSAALTIPLRDDDDDYPALVIGDHILGGGSLSSRLGDRVRQREGLSYGIFSFFNAYAQDERATMSIFAITNPENIDKVKSAIREELDLLLKEGVTEDELAAAKSGYLQKQGVDRSNDASLARILAETLDAGRSMEYHAHLEAKITALTADQVQAALKKYVDPERFVIVTAGDFGSKADAGK
jgi:zinc protease